MDMGTSGSIAKAAVGFAAKRVSDYRIAAAISAAYSQAAYETISAVEIDHPARSPVWNEVASVLGNADKAAAILKADQSTLEEDIILYLQAFTLRLVGCLHELVPPDQLAATESVLTAVFGVRTDIELMSRRLASIDTRLRDSDPNSLLPWWDRPGAPQISIRPGLDNRDGGTRVYGNISIRSEPLVGALTLRVGAAEDSLIETRLMLENSSRTGDARYQFKPTELQLSGDSSEVLAVVSFTWAGSHLARWRWPLSRHEQKGHWCLDAHLGTPLDRPDLA